MKWIPIEEAAKRLGFSSSCSCALYYTKCYCDPPYERLLEWMRMHGSLFCSASSPSPGRVRTKTAMNEHGEQIIALAYKDDLDPLLAKLAERALLGEDKA